MLQGQAGAPVGRWTDGQPAPDLVAVEGELLQPPPCPAGLCCADGDSGQALIFNFILLPPPPPPPISTACSHGTECVCACMQQCGEGLGRQDAAALLSLPSRHTAQAHTPHRHTTHHTDTWQQSHTHHTITTHTGQQSDIHLAVVHNTPHRGQQSHTYHTVTHHTDTPSAE